MVYSIHDDWLHDNSIPVRNEGPTPHISSGRNICDFVIIHYTGSWGKAGSSITWANDPASKVSWHLTISRDGVVTQLHDFRAVTWHAGKSEWYAESIDRHYVSMNKYGIGIELANAGPLTRARDGYYTPYDQEVPQEQVFIDDQDNPWESFSEAQILAAEEISLALAQAYKCVDILGHSMISPGRKVDPGPAFPMKRLRGRLREMRQAVALGGSYNTGPQDFS